MNADDETSKTLSASDRIRREIHDVIRRYGEESDVTVYQALGVLRMVEHDLIAMLDRAQQDDVR